MTLPAVSAPFHPRLDGLLPAGTRVRRDLAYASAHPRQKLDLLLPPGPPAPVVLWIHGGGWLGGDKDDRKDHPEAAAGALWRYDQVDPAMRLPARGFAVASLNYRYSSIEPFPAQIDDCQAAVRWLRENASALGIRGDRIGAWGASAGGHLAALLATAAGRFADRDSAAVAVQAAVDYFGPTDFSQMDAEAPPHSRHVHDAPHSPESRLIGGPVPQHPDRVQRANPIAYISTTSAPLFVVHGADDPAVPVGQSRRLHAALREVGAVVDYRELPGAGHGGPAFDAAEPFDAVVAFLRRYLHV